jgi:GH24 family phage-related lysozyme (muramidase)
MASPALTVRPAGKLTIAWGHVIRMTDRLAPPIDLARAQQLFDDDVAPTAIYVRAACGPAVLTQCAFDALVSFAFNVGVRAFETSTLRRYVKASQMSLAAAQFRLWNKSTVTDPRGRKMLLPCDGLTIRRELERMLFEGADDAAIRLARADLEARAAAGSLA